MTTLRDEFKSWARQNLPHIYPFMDFTLDEAQSHFEDDETLRAYIFWLGGYRTALEHERSALPDGNSFH